MSIDSYIAERLKKRSAQPGDVKCSQCGRMRNPSAECWWCQDPATQDTPFGDVKVTNLVSHPDDIGGMYEFSDGTKYYWGEGNPSGYLVNTGGAVDELDWSQWDSDDKMFTNSGGYFPYDELIESDPTAPRRMMTDDELAEWSKFF